MELHCEPEADMDSDIKRDVLILIGIALITKVVITVLTLQAHSFIDFWDMSYYFESVFQITQGQIPYLDFPVDYPVLALLPMILAYTLVPQLPGFFFVFEFFMLICDALAIVGIYYIAVEVWGSKTRAFRAGLLYAIALPVAYFTLVRFDPLPVAIMIWAVLFTIRGESMKGYLTALVGFLTKIFPIVLMPFFILWNAKGKDLKKEILWGGLLAAIFVIPSMLLLGTFTGRVGSSGSVYANTPTYLLHMQFSNILHLPVTANQISAVLYVLAGIAFIWLTIAFLRARKSPVMLLTTLLLAIFMIVFVARLHSPQYIMWYLPFLCLLVSDDLYLMLALVAWEIIAYLEFPILFRKIYTNAEYVAPVGSGLWYWTLVFFSLEYLVMLLIIFAVIRKNWQYFERKSIIIAGEP
jgi:hypothetical protein